MREELSPSLFSSTKICMFGVILSGQYQTGWSAYNIVDLYLGTPQFECWPGHQKSLQTFRVFLQSILANASMVPQLCHNHFLPNPCQFIIRRCVVQHTDTAVRLCVTRHSDITVLLQSLGTHSQTDSS